MWKVDAADRRVLSAAFVVLVLVVLGCVTVGLAVGLGWRVFLWAGGV